MKHYPKAVCSFIMREDGLILASARKDNKNVFGLPGGKVDLQDKSLEDAARRELFEETGLSAHSGTPVYTAMCYGPDGKHYLTTTFIWNNFTSIPKQMKGEGRVCWVSPYILTRRLYGNMLAIYNQELFRVLNVSPNSHHNNRQDEAIIEV